MLRFYLQIWDILVLRTPRITMRIIADKRFQPSIDRTLSVCFATFRCYYKWFRTHSKATGWPKKTKANQIVLKLGKGPAHFKILLDLNFSLSSWSLSIKVNFFPRCAPKKLGCSSCFFLLRHFGHLSRIMILVAVTAFTSPNFRTLWPNWLNFFFDHLQKIWSIFEKWRKKINLVFKPSECGAHSTSHFLLNSLSKMK